MRNRSIGVSICQKASTAKSLLNPEGSAKVSSMKNQC